MLNKSNTPEISCNTKCSSLTFLLSASREPGATARYGYLKKDGVPWRYWLYGYSAGDFSVQYADGFTATIPMRLYITFNWLDVNHLYRATSDNRYVLPLQSGDGRYLFLYQYEWINPYPDKKINSIKFIPCSDFDFELQLFAVTLRKTSAK